jgi:ferritin-like metal-binding protein YciE
MKFFSANLKDLRELYQNSLQKTLDMEQHIVKALPTMIEKASDPELKQAFEDHLEETKTHVTRVEGILDQAIGETSTIKCKVIAALVSEAEDMIKDAADPTVRDAALISAAQQVEHHEIAVYGTLRTWAEILGETGHAQTLDEILTEERKADEALTGISSQVNRDAQLPVTHAA